MSTGSLPQTIPPQTASLGRVTASGTVGKDGNVTVDGNVTIDLTWYLLLYNISNQVLSSPGGSVTITAVDLLVDSTDIDASAADTNKLRAELRATQALVADAMFSTAESVVPGTVITNLAPTSCLAIPASYGCIVPDYYEIVNGFYVDIANTGVFQIE